MSASIRVDPRRPRCRADLHRSGQLRRRGSAPSARRRRRHRAAKGAAVASRCGARVAPQQRGGRRAVLRASTRRATRRVSYEDVCANTPARLSRFWEFLGVPPFSFGEGWRARNHHVIGNGMRLDSTEEVRLDERWKTAFPPAALEVFEAEAGALNRRLGYRIAARRLSSSPICRRVAASGCRSSRASPRSPRRRLAVVAARHPASSSDFSRLARERHRQALVERAAPRRPPGKSTVTRWPSTVAPQCSERWKNSSDRARRPDEISSVMVSVRDGPIEIEAFAGTSRDPAAPGIHRARLPRCRLPARGRQSSRRATARWPHRNDPSCAD